MTSISKEVRKTIDEFIKKRFHFGKMKIRTKDEFIRNSDFK
jgi:hypothetical protein